MGLYAQKPRTLSKKEDREYLYDKLEKLFSTKLPFLKAKVNRNAKDYLLSKDTFHLYFPFLPENEQEMLKTMEGDGANLAGLFYEEVLKEFPEFKIFSASMPCNNGKKITVNYHYNKNGSISLFSQLKQRWITLACKQQK
jgi:hypothetical protein